MRRTIAGASATTLLALGLLAVTQTAQAYDPKPGTAHSKTGLKGASATSLVEIPCGSSATDIDPSASGHAKSTSNIRSGPSTYCSIAGTAYAGVGLDYHCFVVTSPTESWTFLRSGSVYGWVRDDLLSDNGSHVSCP
ncbi:hypothetical protein [Streptomyces solaniscabiei]|uniref:hypothetical protein n=1 Tax=Streptomyces solaniscabiei TaxID=2683255 RepID=UPI001CE26AFC|nr:hypothetical protein [Streptomyces solaniscabiei]